VTDLLAAAKEAVKAARDAGATAADALAVERRETSLDIRRGVVETSNESERRGIGVRAFRDGRSGVSYTTDVSAPGLRRAGLQATELAAAAGADPAAGLPDPAHRAVPASVSGIEDPEYPSFAPARGVEMAKAAEAAAFASDPRITNSDGASFSATRARMALAASDGFEGTYVRTRFGLSMAAVAEEAGGVLQRDGWYTQSSLLARLDDPESIGREAARRCLRRLGWRKVETRQVPVVFAPEVAASFAVEVVGACCGDALYRRASFLADSLGKPVASAAFTLVDDPTLPGGLGSRPFDAEGARPHRKAIFERGVLRSFLFDSYSLRRLSAEAPDRAAGGIPGNAVRGLAGPTSAGFSNLFVEPGPESPERVLAGVADGFYVTETMGFGVNAVTGDYSKGAAGLWIRDGRLDHAVQEVTIAGDMRAMLQGVEAVGNDLVFRAEAAAPTIRIGRMTVSGT
jgi:PmbA protein